MICRIGAVDFAVTLRQLALVAEQCEDLLATDDLLTGTVRHAHLVGRLRDIGGEAVQLQVLGVAIHDGVDQSVPVDDIRRR